MKIFFDRHPVPHVDDLIPRYKQAEFQSPTRSTVPLCSLLKHGGEIWDRIAEELAADGGPGELHVEYTVPPPQGRGRPSHTDLMLIDGRRAIAIEAKWTEPRYDTVGNWLSQGNDPENRRTVLKGWLSLLEPYAGRTLRVEDFSDAVYQMVHRAASACATGRAPAMAYLHFASPQSGMPDEAARLKHDLTHLRRLLGNPAGFPMHLIELAIQPTPAFDRINDLPKGSENMDDAVRAALLGEPLFEFSKFRLYSIDAGAFA